MSGGINFTQNKFWGVAGWAYRAALATICDSLKTIEKDHGLLEELSAESGSAQAMQHIEVEKWEKDKALVFIQAIQDSYSKLKTQSSSEGVDPSDFSMFIQGFEELLSMAQEYEKKINS